MLTNAIRALVYELFLETFLWENDNAIKFSDSFLYFSWKWC